MISAVDPVTYFHRKRESKCSTERQKGRERDWGGGGGGWCSIQRAINRAVSGDAELKKGGGRIGKAGEEDEAVE